MNEERLDDALATFSWMKTQGFPVPSIYAPSYGVLMKGCAAAMALEKGIKLHQELLKGGLINGANAHDLLGLNLVDFYGKCGESETAQRVFDELSCTPSRDLDGADK